MMLTPVLADNDFTVSEEQAAKAEAAFFAFGMLTVNEEIERQFDVAAFPPNFNRADTIGNPSFWRPVMNLISFTVEYFPEHIIEMITSHPTVLVGLAFGSIQSLRFGDSLPLARSKFAPIIMRKRETY